MLVYTIYVYSWEIYLLDSLVNVLSSVTTQGIVKPSNEFMAVVFRHGHERPSHDTVIQSGKKNPLFKKTPKKAYVHDLNLVDAVSKVT